MVKILIVSGILLIIAGIILWIFPGALKQIGRLPGDLRYKNGNVSFYFPFTSGLIISLILSLIFRFLSK